MIVQSQKIRQVNLTVVAAESSLVSNQRKKLPVSLVSPFIGLQFGVP
jgi:hypothetical protein